MNKNKMNLIKNEILIIAVRAQLDDYPIGYVELCLRDLKNKYNKKDK